MDKLIRLTFIAFLVIMIILLGEEVFERVYKYPEKIEYGVSFSPSFAEFLSLDWQKTYIEILDDLEVKNIRIPGYWSIIEKEQNKDDFSKLDFMVSEAEKRGVKAILVLGVRQPRWPECHIPAWAKSLSVGERQEKILQFINKVVQRYKLSQAVKFWQVENEPLLSSFGKGCDAPDKKFLISEVDLVKSMDTRPIIVTDSGELGFWVTAMRLSDIFGTTLYRTVYNPIFGYSRYPILPYLYNIKSSLVKKLTSSASKRTIIIELQSEPWFINGELLSMSISEQLKLFPVHKLKDNVDFAQKTGFDEMYLWGVEWWYFMAQNGHPEYLQYAKTLFR